MMPRFRNLNQQRGERLEALVASRRVPVLPSVSEVMEELDRFVTGLKSEVADEVRCC